MLLDVQDENLCILYQLLFLKDVQVEIVVLVVVLEDEWIWVFQVENVWFWFLCLNWSQGYWVNLLWVCKLGVLLCYWYLNLVYGFVLKGCWYYLEYDWIVEEGGYVYEFLGEIYILVVLDDVEEMIILFQVNGIMYYVDFYGKLFGYEDVFIKIDMCWKYYIEVGLGEDYVDQFLCQRLRVKYLFVGFGL